MRTIVVLLALIALSAGGCAPKEGAKPVAYGTKTSSPKADPEKGKTSPPTVTPEDKKTDEKSPPTTDPPKKPPVDVPPIKQATARPGDEAVRKAMHNIGIAHQLFTDERSRTPASAEELEKFLDAGTKAKQMLKDGIIVVMWKSTKADDPAKAVLAYEAAADKNGRRLVLTADYTLDVLPDAEFEKLPKVPQKK